MGTEPRDRETREEDTSEPTGNGAGLETRVGVDVGGTFTDVVLAVENRLVTAKVPTTDDQSVGVLTGIEKACEQAAIDPAEIDEFAHAMTVSVNALLERDGAKTALVTTKGFRDVLEIGRQDRPDLYDLEAVKPDPLVPRRRRFELEERTTPDGRELAVDPDAVRTLAATLREFEIESVVVCFLHSYADPENERVTAEILREDLDVPVSVSHEVLAEFREFERSSTTAVDAYVRPVIEDYVGRLVEEATAKGVPEPRIMRANGGIADPETVRERAVTTVLSGPAAGVVGAAETVEDASLEGLVTFDMGGTSSDVSLVRDGQAERTTDAEIDGLPIRTPMVDVNTVGAGGGSIAWVDPGGALRVGPRSAGANPGPVCYGRGGSEPTVTDANVVLGYVGPETALGGELTLDIDAAHDVLADLAEAAGLENALEAARGVYRVANATMTRTIRSVTVERGHDPREFALVAFGGAGPMHACGLAAELGIDRVVVPRPSGVLSAFGLLAADENDDAVRTVRVALADADEDHLEDVFDDLVSEVLAGVSEPDAARIERVADCRYDGQSFELSVPIGAVFDRDAIEEQFHAAHERAYGYAMADTAAIEIVNLRATATVDRPAPRIDHEAEGEAEIGTRAAQFPGIGERMTTVYERDRLEPGRTVEGPAILEQAESTTVVPPAWAGDVRSDGRLVVSRTGIDSNADRTCGDRDSSSDSTADGGESR